MSNFKDKNKLELFLNKAVKKQEAKQCLVLWFYDPELFPEK